MISDKLQALVIDALEDIKAVDIKQIDVRESTSITDVMVIATGTSTRHVKSVADTVIEKVKKAGFSVLGVEGEQACDWVLVDLGDVVLHIMLADVRDFYALEKLWSVQGDKQGEHTDGQQDDEGSQEAG